MKLLQAQLVQIFLLLGGYLGTGYFWVGIYFTLQLMYSVHYPAMKSFSFVFPYMGISGLFVTSIVFGHLGKLRLSTAILIVGLLVSVAACAYDFKNSRYQSTGSGYGPTYTMWWWYYEPYWKGYKPGMV